MKTKKEKIEKVKQEIKNLSENEMLVIVDFTGVKTNELNFFRNSIKKAGGKLKVIKKRLLGKALEGVGIDFKKDELQGQTGVVFSNKIEPSVVFREVFKFSKEHKNLKILGGFYLTERKFIEAQEIKLVGGLPGPEILVAQIINILRTPICSFLYILKERSRKA